MPCSGSSPILVAATWADIADCHDNHALNGATRDVITVTPGNQGTITTSTSISKHVEVVMIGVTVTDNTGISSQLFDVTPSTIGNIKFSGGTITQGASNINRTAPDGCFVIGTTVGGKTVLFTGITYTANNGLFIYSSTPKIVAWGNTMTAVPSGGSCFNNSAFFRLDGGLAWSSPSTAGALDTTGENNAYFEGNTLVNVMEGIDSNADGRIVSRFNTITNSGTVAHDTTSTGSRQYEYYNNTWIYDQVTGACGADPPNINGIFQFRMGTGILFGNVLPDITSGSWGPKNEITLEGANLRRHVGAWPCWNVISAPGQGWPAPRQPGWGYTVGGTEVGEGTSGGSVFQDLEPVYIANNTGAGNYENPTVTDFNDADGESCLSQHGGSPSTYPYSADYIISDREFYKQVAYGSFNGSTGASQGTRNQMNLITTCTEGVGFWVTDEGNWNGENATVGTPGYQKGHGQLYRCGSSNNWQLYYTPYSYPHPLAGGSPPIEPPPSTITGPTYVRPDKPGRRRRKLI